MLRSSVNLHVPMLFVQQPLTDPLCFIIIQCTSSFGVLSVKEHVLQLLLWLMLSLQSRHRQFEETATAKWHADQVVFGPICYSGFGA